MAAALLRAARICLSGRQRKSPKLEYLYNANERCLRAYKSFYLLKAFRSRIWKSAGSYVAYLTPFFFGPGAQSRTAS